MYKDERDLLDVLKAELEFAEKGGYGRSPREPWRGPSIFQDSPACMNYDSKAAPDSCSQCVLMQLVPARFRETLIPCHHIPLNKDGETLDSLTRYADQFEIEEAYKKWLTETVAALESVRQETTDANRPASSPLHVGTAGAPLFQKLHPKCANPACPTEFHWLGGGKFFRFRPDPASQSTGKTEQDAATRGVKHFWLCEHCSLIFTLAFEEGSGVMLKLLWSELLSAESPKLLTATAKREKSSVEMASSR